jgi:hypothetical protein
MVTIFAYTKQLGCMVTMGHNSNQLLSKAHQRTLSLNNFKMIEAMGLKLLHRDPLE